METALRFADPPDKHSRRRSYDWTAIYAMIRDNPGQWLLFAEPGYMSTYNAVKQFKISNFNPGMGVEIKSANSDYNASPRTADLYVRYNPDLDESLTVKARQKMWAEIRRNEKEKKMTVSTVETED